MGGHEPGSREWGVPCRISKGVRLKMIGAISGPKQYHEKERHTVCAITWLKSHSGSNSSFLSGLTFGDGMLNGVSNLSPETYPLPSLPEK